MHGKYRATPMEEGFECRPRKVHLRVGLHQTQEIQTENDFQWRKQGSFSKHSVCPALNEKVIWIIVAQGDKKNPTGK